MQRAVDRLAQGILALDGAGCLVAAVAAIGAPSLMASIDTGRRSRLWVAGALAASGIAMLNSAVRRPDPWALRVAAAINAGGVASCLAVLPGQRGLGRGLVLATATLDAAAGTAQLLVAKKRLELS
jgi:hypothetical protein